MGALTRLLRATTLAASLLALSATPAAAAVFDANPAAADGTSGSLRERIQAAGANDTVRLPPGTYRLTLGQLNVDKTLTLEGLGQQASQVVVTSEGRGRVIYSDTGAGEAVTLRRLQVSGGRASGGIGAGILKVGPGSLTLEEVTVSGNSVTGSEQGGGGLAVAAGNASIRRSTVADNSATVSTANSGGGGILHTGSGALSLVNSTLAGNRVTVSGAPAGVGSGSAILNLGGTLTLEAVSIGYNTTSPGGLGALRSVTTPTLRNTIVAANGLNCVGNFDSLGFNIDSDNTCDLDATGDQPGIDPGIQPLADIGGPTPTLRLPPTSPAINSGDCGSLTTDQRNAARPALNETSCDVGAVEFEGWAKVEVPPCTRTGALPFSVNSPPETGLEALNYTLDGGPVADPLQIAVSGTSATGTLQIDGEGRRRLEYWADSFPTGTQLGVQLKHSTPTVVIDRTDPRVQVSNPNAFRVFVIKRDVSVDVDASDSISGLVVDPSGSAPIDTSARGSRTFRAGAVDLCTNTAAAPFDYRVLAPGLGVRTVVERVRGTVLTVPGIGSARASQKGQSLTEVREPREVPVSSLIDARKGTVRVTASRDTRTGIQDAEFSGGRFQVLQSRRRSARGLTELRLKGSSFRSCGRAGRSGRASGSARKRVIRRLRGRGSGRFRTRGRYSAATVRGTTWTVEDRCDGTLTRVTSGRVLVRDFRRKRTIVVRAGKSYLARARR